MPAILRLSVALFAVQAGFHGFTAAMPLALHRAGVPDPEIGLVMGSAGAVQLVAAFVVAGLVDRFGGARMFAIGGLLHLVAAAILLVPGVDPAGDRLPFVLARTIQGVALAMSIPSALSLVPRLVPAQRSGLALSIVGSAHNLTMVILPPLSLALLGAATSLDSVAIGVIVFVGLGLGLAATVGLGPRASAGDRRDVAADADLLPEPWAGDTIEPAIGAGADPIDGGPTVRPGARPGVHRRFGIAFRTSWSIPLALMVLYVAHWGAVLAYLPARAEVGGADVGLFFAADGLAVLAVRIPSGSLVDRVPSRWLILAGLAMGVVAVALLLPPPSTPILVLSGLIGGAGGGLVLTPVLVELSRRSDEADRGSAFSLFSGALAAAITLGSFGGAPLIAVAGFEMVMVVGIVGIVAAGVVALGDAGFAAHPRRAPRAVSGGAAG